MKESLESIIFSLVEDQSSVSIKEIVDGSNVKYEVSVADKDMGRVIGKKGKIAQSIRTVMKAIAAKEDKKVVVEFID
jgi:predicted RNA-binding protein YlqC (UPF0109 family)